MRLNAARLPALPLAAALVLGGCGNEAAESPGLQVGPNAPVKRVSFPRQGVELTVPREVRVERRPRPGVFRLFLGEPFVSMFAYPRREQIPRRTDELKAARRRLVKEVERRGQAFELVSSSLTEVDGAKAIELVGDQTIMRGRLHTRSVHVYKRKAEYVIELLAPRRDYARVEREVFEPLLRSLRLSGEVEPARKAKKNKKG